MRRNLLALFGSALTPLFLGELAYANIEPPAAYDARSVGMGSTGVAHVHNGASLYHNPAALGEVQSGAITATFSPLLPQTKGPLTTPETEASSERGFFPMFLVGGAYRVHPKLTLGLAAYPTMGFASTYKNNAQLGGLELSAKLAAMEISPGAAYNLTDRIAIGLAYRLTYMTYGMHQPTAVPDAAGNLALVDTKVDVSGWNFLGIQAGVFAKLTDTTRLGLTYRNKVPVTMKGDTTMAGQNLKTELEFSAPHSFKLGAAQSLLDDQLLIAIDLKMALYKNSAKSLAMKVDTPAGKQTNEIVLDWKNSFGVHAGAEYRFAPQGLRARLGYSLTQSATSESHPLAVLPPPGLQHSIHVGAGVSYSQFDLDLGGYYLFGSKHATPEGGVPGDYSMNAFLFGLGGTYRI